jgi:hypothetical protein
MTTTQQTDRSFVQSTSGAPCIADREPPHCHPVLGIAWTLLGTSVAIALVPENPEPKGALFWPAVAQVVGLLVAPAVAFWKAPRNLLRTENIIAASPIYWLLLDLVQGVYNLPGLRQSDVQFVFLLIGLFITMFWIGCFGRPWRIPNTLRHAASVSLPASTLFAAIFVCFGICMFRFAYPCGFDPRLMVDNLGAPRFMALWSRGKEGGWDAFLDHMAYFGYILPALTVTLARRSSWRDPRVWLSIGLSACVVLFLSQDGGRRIIGMTLGAALFCWAIERSRFRWKHLLIAAVYCAVVLAAMQFMRESRTIGYSHALFSKQEQWTSAEPEEDSELILVDDNFYRFCQVVILVPNYYPYALWRYPLFVAVRPIPRVFWPGKPTEGGFDLPTALGVEGVSYSSSFISECYFSFGIIGVLVGGLLYGRLASATGALLQRSSGTAAAMVYGLAVMVLFSGMRSAQDLVLMSYSVLVWIVVARLLGGRPETVSAVTRTPVYQPVHPPPSA